MSREIFTGILLILFGVVIASLSRILLKYAAGIQYVTKISEYCNLYVVGGYMLFLITTFINVYALRFLPLSLASALDASGQVFVPLFSCFILKENINKKKLRGMFIIVVGILLFFV